MERRRGSLRRNAEYNYSRDTHPFFDLVIDLHSNSTWALNSHELILINPAVGYPPGRDFSPMVGELRMDLAQFFFGGISLTSTPDVDPSTYRLSGSNVVCLIGDKARGLVAEFTIDWDSNLSRGFVRALKYVVASGQYAGRTETYQGWVYDQAAAHWRATRFTQRDADGTIRRDYTFLESRVITPEEFAAVIEPPTPLRPDAIRGVASYERIADYRSGKHESIRVDRQDPANGEAASAQQIDERVRKRPGRRMLIRILGGGGILIVGVVCWWFAYKRKEG